MENDNKQEIASAIKENVNELNQLIEEARNVNLEVKINLPHEASIEKLITVRIYEQINY